MILLNQIDSHQIPADRFSDSRAKESEGDKVEGRRPHHSITGGQHPRRNYRGNGVRGIVKTVGEIKDECDQNDEKDKDDGRIDLRHSLSWLGVRSASGVLDHDALTHVANVLATIDRGFKILIKILQENN